MMKMNIEWQPSHEWQPSYEIKYAPLPEHIGGALTTNSDGTYLIVINAILDAEHQHSAIGHELAHLYLGHLESDLPAEEKEASAEYLSGRFYKDWKERIMINKNYIMKKLDAYGLTIKDLSAQLGMSESRLKKCIEGNKDFTVGDVKIISNVLKLNPSEVSAVFFWGVI